MPRTGIRPHTWKIDSNDPVDHKLFTDCQRARAQAWYRGEEWHITEEEYINLWRTEDRYLKKGRTAESLCMTKVDHDLDWTLDNVQFISRREHFKTCNQYKMKQVKQRRLQRIAEKNV